MSRMTRRSKRQRQKDKRRAKRRENRKHGKKAGSIAIHSLLPGLEGTELGSMQVVIDARRTEEHPALVNVVVHHHEQQRAVIWSIETGFGGMAPRVGYRIALDGPIEALSETTWLPMFDGSTNADDKQVKPTE